MSETAQDGIRNAFTLYRRGDLENARAAYAEALQLAVAETDLDARAQALTGIGKIDRDLGKTDSAVLHYQQAANLLHTLAVPLRLAHTVRHVGDILSDQGHLEEALPCFEEAIALYREHPDAPPLDVANALAGFARLQTRREQKTSAAALWREARDLYASLDLRPGVDEAEKQLAQLA